MVHTLSDDDQPGGLSGGGGLGADGMQLGDLAACIKLVNDEFALLRDVALVNEVTWIDTGLRGNFQGEPRSRPGSGTPPATGGRRSPW